MSISSTDNLADLIVAKMAEDLDITATRVLSPKNDIKDFTNMVVEIIPKGRTITREGREYYQNAHSIVVGIRQKVTDINDPTQTDPIGAKVEAIQKWFLGGDGGLNIDGIPCTEIHSVLDDDSIYGIEKLRTSSLYASILIASFLE